MIPLAISADSVALTRSMVCDNGDSYWLCSTQCAATTTYILYGVAAKKQALQPVEVVDQIFYVT